jgi:transcription initiation factor TFIID TATA-box-binding protein
MRKRKYSVLTGESSVPEDAPTPMVHNIVATCQINSTLATLDLESIHAMLPFSFYDKRKFAAITIRLHDPACTTLLFSSGKTVVTGGRFVSACVFSCTHH